MINLDGRELGSDEEQSVSRPIVLGEDNPKHDWYTNQSQVLVTVFRIPSDIRSEELGACSGYLEILVTSDSTVAPVLCRLSLETCSQGDAEVTSAETCLIARVQFDRLPFTSQLRLELFILFSERRDIVAIPTSEPLANSMRCSCKGEQREFLV